MIFEELPEDVSKSFRSMDLTVGKAKDTVVNHFNKLLKYGVIRCSTLVMNLEKLATRKGQCSI
jgi:hypothetical protein